MGARLVGRRAALDTLRAAVDAARSGRGQFVVVTGEPGIGKTALLTEATREAAGGGARVLWGHCWEGDGAPAYWPWVQVLRAGALAGLPAPPPDAARMLPEHALARGDAAAATAQRGSPPGAVVPATEERTFPPGAPPATAEREPPHGAGDSTHERFRLFDATARFLSLAATEGPVVLALDDLQWADEPSLRLLAFAARHLRSSPVLIIGAYRDTEASDLVRQVTAAGQHLRLGALTPDAVPELIAAVTGAPPADAVADEIWRRTGGNPFFILELTRLMAAGGGAGGRRPAGIVDSVRETLERRLARLSQPCADLLAVAAVAGTAVRPEILGRLRGEVADLLAEATGARVLVAPDAPLEPYRFAHDLFRETIVAGLVPSALAALHLDVGRALEALRADGAEIHAAELARHFAAAAATAGAADDAVRYATLAAEEASAQLGFEEACAHYGRALRALDLVAAPDPATRVALLMALAAAQARAGRPQARDTYLQAAGAARRCGHGDGLARAALGVHGLGARSGSSFNEHIALLEEAAAPDRAGGVPARAPAGTADGPPHGSALRARVLAALSRELRHSHQPANVARAPGVAEQATAIAREAGDPGALAFCLLALHDARWWPGTAAHRLPVIDEMLALAADAGDRDLLAQAHLLRATALLEEGDPHGRGGLQEYCRLADASGHARGRWGALSRRATLALIAGRLDEADELSAAALRLGGRIGEPDAHGVRGTQQVALALLGHSPWRADGELPSHALAPATRGLRLAGDGDAAAARTAVAGLSIDELPVVHDLEALTIAVAAIVAAGTEPQRTAAYDRLAPHAGTHVVVSGCAAYYGAVDHHLGVLAAALDRRARAVAHLEAAVTLHERLGSAAWAERSHAMLDDLRGTAADERVFRRDGDVWTLSYGGTRVHLPDAKGLRDIATLLATPGAPVHALDLVGAAGPRMGADPVLDDRARAVYRARLDDLDAEIDAAGAHRDPVRAARARAERDALIEQLSAAAGLGGRTRRLGDTGERARKAVTARIRDAMERIARQHPDLGRHLQETITTGTSCAYTPSTPLRWRL